MTLLIFHALLRYLRVYAQFKSRAELLGLALLLSVHRYTTMSQTVWRVVCTILQVLGVLITILRLGYRVWTRMLWVEDMWAFVALVCGVTSLIAGWKISYTDGGQSAGSWVYGFAFPSAIWAVRQNILFSVARIFWSARSLRLKVIGIALAFLVLYGALVAQRAWQYGHDLDWYDDWYNHPDENEQEHVYLTHPVIIFELITNCVSDTIVVSFASQLLCGIRLPAKERIMIMTAMSTSIIVMIFSIFQAVCQLNHIRSIWRIATDLELAVALITCNLLAATTYIYGTVTRRRRSVSESKSDSDIVFSQNSSLDGRGQLVTVDLAGYSGDGQSASQAEP
ncbi:uncharacterized protein HD556DRAFT_670773 [Suillus plorans]|uniref:Integral membrane protein n=1 Tax=Suillus plorans TaxID=116603 RepID=A0A9P7ALN2_9AGAM|nr:uncharacterized protein HD556DRAFT_670773 [Suillus plorans]KAG1790919.1 hypothetical protein HD556DRAFT_670773 [Suillus plorans]